MKFVLGTILPFFCGIIFTLMISSFINLDRYIGFNRNWSEVVLVLLVMVLSPMFRDAIGKE